MENTDTQDNLDTREYLGYTPTPERVDPKKPTPRLKDSDIYNTKKLSEYNGTNLQSTASWAMTAEKTNPFAIQRSVNLLQSGNYNKEEEAQALYTINRDKMIAQGKRDFYLSQIYKANEQGNDDLELECYFGLLGYDKQNLDQEEICRVFWGERSKEQTLDYIRTTIGKAINFEEDKELTAFEAMDDEDKRAFIEEKFEDRRTKREEKTLSDHSGFLSEETTMIVTDKMTDEQYAEWSEEYKNNTKHKQVWQILETVKPEYAGLALAISSIEDDDSLMQFVPQLERLSADDRQAIYWATNTLNPRMKSAWWKLLDNTAGRWFGLGDAWNLVKDFASLDPKDVTQWIDEQGGLDSVFADEIKSRKLYSEFFANESDYFTNKQGKRIVSRRGKGFSLSNLRGKYTYSTEETDLRSEAEKIYKEGKKFLQTREIIESLEFATSTKYSDVGYIQNGVIEGASMAVEVGIFVGLNAVTGGTSTVLKAGATAVGIASKSSKAASVASTAMRVSGGAVSLAGKYASVPYWTSAMAISANEEMRERGISDNDAFLPSLAVGVTSMLLEKVQFGIRTQNPFIFAKISNAFANKKEFTRAVLAETAYATMENQGKIFAKDYAIEMLQAFTNVAGVELTAGLSDKEAKELKEIINALAQEATDLIIPMLTMTAIGGNFEGSFNMTRNFLRAEHLGKDNSALLHYVASSKVSDARIKGFDSGYGISIKEIDAYRLGDEKQKQEVVKQLNLSKKDEVKATKLLEDLSNQVGEAQEDFRNSIIEKVKTKEENLALAESQLNPEQEATEDVVLKALMNMEAYGLDVDGFEYVSSLENASQEVKDLVFGQMQREGKSSEQIDNIIKNNKIEGFYRNGKIYLVGSPKLTLSRAMQILKHEFTHKQSASINNSDDFRGMIDELLKANGGEEFVKSAIRAVKGLGYDNLDTYTLGEEFLAMLAEKVQGRHELSEQEKTIWTNAKDWLVKKLRALPEDREQQEKIIADNIRKIWAGEIEGGAFDNLFEQEEAFNAQEEVAKAKQDKGLSPEKRAKAKKNLEHKRIKRQIESNKKLSEEEKELATQKLDLQRVFDSIAEDNASDKLQVLEAVEDDRLYSDEMLEWADSQGASWAGDILLERIQEQEKANISDSNIADIMVDNGYKLPTPKSMREADKKRGLKIGGTIIGEVTDLYNSLNIAQQQRYFTPNEVNIDDLASTINGEFGTQYEGMNDFFDDVVNGIEQREARLANGNAKFSLADNAESETKAVKAQYANTPIYMKAPNGEPTKLTEQQWLQVRTPSFKKWFGDWKTLAEYNVLNGDVVASIKGNEIIKQEGLVGAVMDYYKNIIGKTTFANPILGDIEIKDSSIKSSISKGMGEKKANAFAVIGDVLEKGIIVDYQKNWKDRGYDTALICAPIEIKSKVDNEIKSEIFIVEAVVEQSLKGGTFYVHEVIQKEKLGNTFQQGLIRNNAKSPSVSQASIHNVVKKIFNVKPESVSKVVDENGEPLVVYHGTPNSFNKFSKNKSINGTFWFTLDNKYAKEYATQKRTNGVVMPLFVNLKNPANRDQYDDLELYKFEYKGLDGFLDLDENVGFAFNPTQIKSATDNIGTFDGNNEDIRFSLADETDSKHKELYERYKQGDIEALAEAQKLVDDVAEARGYEGNFYHGSPNHNITEFRDESYFSKDKEYSQKYAKGKNGKIYKTKLKLKKPFDTRNPKEKEIFENEFFGKWGNGTPLSRSGLPDWTDGTDLFEFLQENSYDYDGMILDEGSTGGYGEPIIARPESYIPIKASQIKLQDPFTLDDNGELVPLSERFNSNNEDMRFSFADEIDQYIAGTLPKGHVFKLGNTPAVMTMLGIDDLPIELNSIVLEKKENKHGLNIEDLKALPFELENPIAIIQSKKYEDSKIILTEIPSINDNTLVAVIRINAKNGTLDINKISSVYNKENSSIQSWVNDGFLLYANTQKKPSWLKLPSLQLHSYNNNQKSYGKKVLTENDLSQYKNIGKSPKPQFSYADDNSYEEARVQAVGIATSMLERLAQDFDRKKPNAFEEIQANDEEKESLYIKDPTLSDENLDFIMDRARSIFVKALKKVQKRKNPNYAEIAKEEEIALEYASILEEQIREYERKIDDIASKKNMSSKLRKMDRQEFKNIKGFSSKELEDLNIDLTEAVLSFVALDNGDNAPNAELIKAEIDKIVDLCTFAGEELGLSQEEVFQRIKLSLKNAFNNAISEVVLSSNSKSAYKALDTMLKSATLKSLIGKADKLAIKVSESVAKELEGFNDIADKEQAKADKQKDRYNKLKEKNIKLKEYIEELKANRKAKDSKRREKALREKIINSFVRFAKNKKNPKANVLDIKRKLPAKVEAYLAVIKKVLLLDKEAFDKKLDELEGKRINSLSTGDGDFVNSSWTYLDDFELSALQIFGNINDKTNAQLLQALSELKKLIKGARDSQIKQREALRAKAQEQANPLIESLELRAVSNKKLGSLFAGGFKSVSMYEHMLNGTFLRKGLKGDTKTSIKKWIKDMSKRVSRASLEERNFITTEGQWLKNTMGDIYASMFKHSKLNTIEEQALRRLYKIDDSLAKFASLKGREMSLGQVMQILVVLEQKQVYSAYRNAKASVENRDAKGEDVADSYRETYEYWENLYSNKEAMEALLTEQDKAFVNALKQRYAQRAEQVNVVYEPLNGLPLLSNGADYMPIARKKDYNLDGASGARAIEIFPSHYKPRSTNLRELDEDMNIISLFNQRMIADAHFINFAEITFEQKELFRNKKFSDALKNRLNQSDYQKFMSFTRDILSGKLEGDKAHDKGFSHIATRLTSFMGLALNLGSAFKQFASVPAYALETEDWIGSYKELFSSGEFLSTFGEYWNSPFLKDRRDGNYINQILADIERDKLKGYANSSITENVFARLAKKYAYKPLQLVDSLANLLGGLGVYYNLKKQYMALYSEAEAIRLAMADTAVIGERTQQSSLIVNMGADQRQGSAMKKMFTTFRSTNQLYLSYEVNAIRKYKEDPSRENLRNLGKTLVLNHFILPPLFNALGLAVNMFLGDFKDWDDDDTKYFWTNTIVQCFLGVLQGWWVSAVLPVGIQNLVLNKDYDITSSMLPASSLARLLPVMQDFATDPSEIRSHLNKMAKAVLPAYRMVAKGVENYSE